MTQSIESNGQRYVYLSYLPRDEEAAEKVRRALRGAGMDVVTPWTSSGGIDLERAIGKAMQMCDCYAVIVSTETTNSKWTAFEVGAARAWGRPIYAIRTEGAPVPEFLSAYMVYSLANVSEFVAELVRSAEPLSKTEQALLMQVYRELGIPLKELRTQPDAGLAIVEEFNRRSPGEPVQVARVLRTLTQMKHAQRKRKRRKRLDRMNRIRSDV